MKMQTRNANEHGKRKHTEVANTQCNKDTIGNANKRRKHAKKTQTQ